ncbi:OLC1v1038845C1 [Oldenlandia corymbosa var. corymbosa]|uniref:OLC1v1038845C1 n=1 Tax=Oldenlandia corymbosa var. corymbosa TaxID=529605 RepID=A0AAV1D1Q2_OLDCO|nr:OLC1v1038845C1 [Oldenlandia corymbosa var. corymbosa]
MELAMKEEDHELQEGVIDAKLSESLHESEPKSSASAVAERCRKDKRKSLKKEKRKQKRKEAAEKARQEEEARVNDPDEQRRIQLEEEREKERREKEMREFEEKERLFLEALARKKAQEEEEEERRRALEAEKQNENQGESEMAENEDGEWEYVEEGPPEIIWQGNEIIIKKNKVRVKKKPEQINGEEDPDRPTSNPLLPQSQAFADFKNTTMLSAQQLLENVAQQVPNFGTEQDKAHCPFHLKTGACRFGSRCSRVHFYPDKSCTLLIKNMYNGPGLAWEQDEGLEYTDEEVEHSYEEFYEDVHTEFLKFGEIINFKVCRNGSHHLRGNVYVHYVSLDAAVLAYQAINGRYFAAKQVSCEFVGVTKWRVAICGEYMKSKFKTCSRGTACNFIHCFRNPGGDYEWADWDKPPPKYWVKKMAALFGYAYECDHEKGFERESSEHRRYSSKRSNKVVKYQFRRSQSREVEYSSKSPRDHYDNNRSESNTHRRRYSRDHDSRRPRISDEKDYEVERDSTRHRHDKRRKKHYDSESDRDWEDRDHDADGFHDRARKTSRSYHYGRSGSVDSQETRSGSLEYLSGSESSCRGMGGDKHRRYPTKRSRKQVSSVSGHNRDYSTNERSYPSDSSREELYENRKSFSSNDHSYRKRRKYASDSTGDSSDEITQGSHDRRRKSRTPRNEPSQLSTDHWDSGRDVRDKHHRREYDHAKSNLQTHQTQDSADKVMRHHSSRKNANGDHRDGKDDNSDRRIIQQQDNVDEEETHKKRRKSRSHSQIEEYPQRDNVDEEETHKKRRKSHEKSRSHTQIKEYSQEARSVSRSESRSSKHKRKKTSSRQLDSDED